MRFFKAALLLLVTLASNRALSQITVSITSPVGGMNFATGSTISLNATASEGNTAISSVAFYQGATLLGNGTLVGSTYIYSWASVAAGTYSLTAKATDIHGSTQTSSSVSITVSGLSILNTWAQGGNAFGAQGQLGTNDNNRLVFKTNGLEKATILPNGNVGIGTSNPQAQFHTTGSMLFGNFLNNSNSDSVLSTDVSGNLHLLNRPQLTYDNGLIQSGNEITVGGDVYNSPFELAFFPDGGSNPDGTYENGQIYYYGNDGYSDMDLAIQSGTDTTEYDVSLNMYTDNASGFELYGTNYSTSGNNSSTGFSVGNEGTSVFEIWVDDPNGQNDNGISLFSNWMALSEPSIQLPFYLNDNSRDSVLVTDSLGYLHQKAISDFGGNLGYVFDNGLTQNGDEVYAGGLSTNYSYSFVISPPDQNTNNSNYETGGFGYEGSNGNSDWYLNLESGFDTIYNSTGVNVATGYFGAEVYTSFENGKWNDVAAYLSTQGEGNESAVYSMTVADSTNESYNGINLFSSWMQLNEPLIQMPYYPNDGAQDSVLVTDSLGYIHQKAISSFINFAGDNGYVFDNGLTENGNEVYAGGTSTNYGYDFAIQPPDQGTSNGNYESGELAYSGSNGYSTWSLAVGGGFDSLNIGNGTEMDIGIGYFGTEVYTGFGNGKYNDAGIYISTQGNTVAELGVADTVNENYQGIDIYSTWMELNEPSIQLPYFLNDSGGDSVLVTDSQGYLHQKAISSFLNFAGDNGYVFDNGLTQNGSEVYAGGTSTNYDYSFSIQPPDQNTNNGNYESGNFGFEGENGVTEWYLNTESGFDTVENSSSLGMSTGYFGTEVYTQYTNGLWGDVALNMSTQGEGNLGAFYSVTVVDSSNDSYNGLSLYSSWMQLDEPSLQLPYYLNDTGEDSVLVTDSQGYLHQKAISSFLNFSGDNGYVFDNGLIQNGTEVYAGGQIINNEFDFAFMPNGGGTNPDGTYESGNFEYYGNDGYSYINLATQGGLDGGTEYDAGLYLTNDGESQFSLEATDYPAVGLPGIVGVQGFANNNGGPVNFGIYLDDSISNSDNGLVMYSNWMQIFEPSIQLAYFPNDANQDSVLVTDQSGYLHQKAVSSFLGNSRWTFNGTFLYDTLDYIGIGTNNPQSQLAVNGTITAQKLVVTQSGWPDYVFDSSYSLMKVPELENYIREHRHLPGIAPATEIEKSGLDVGGNQTLLLKKIEELTLYIIEQDKRIQELSQRTKELSDEKARIDSLQDQLAELKKVIESKK